MCRVLNKHHAGIPGRRHLHRARQQMGQSVPDRPATATARPSSPSTSDGWRTSTILLRALDELRGRDLVCFCAPRACHGDLLLRLANTTRDERVAWWRAVKAAA